MHAMAFGMILMSHIFTNVPHKVQMLICTSNPTSTAHENKCTEFNLTLQKMRRKKNLVMFTLNAHTFFTSIWDWGGISAGSDSWGCMYDGRLILWDGGPCQCTTEINTKIRSARGLYNSEFHVNLSNNTHFKP